MEEKGRGICMNFLKYLKNDIELEKILLNQYEEEIIHYPEGRLCGKRIRGKQKYYQVKKDGTAKYISKENKALLIALRTKRLMLKSIKILQENLKWQEKLLQHYKSYDLDGVEVRLAGGYSEEALREWAKGPYRQNPFYKEYKVFQTSFGLMVRSKAEVMIAELLHGLGIPFQYDVEVLLQDTEGYTVSYYMDFVILTPTGKKIYWEHMGKFYEEGYREHNLKKICLYYDNGIILGNNFIITMESKKGGLSGKRILELIEGQILPYFA